MSWPCLEVCVDCVESAINAEAGGASRLELCSALSEGGLTPTPGLLKAVSSVVKIPIYCILRPRRGGDFVYSREEVEAMKTDALLLRAVGRVDGFVFGALNLRGELDAGICRELIDTTHPLPATLHRAIDVCVNPLEAVDVAVLLGFKRILTSGCERTAEKGIDMIKKMIARADGKIIIMPGAGINAQNASTIIQETRAVEIHASARSCKRLARTPSSACSMSAADPGESLFITDDKIVSDIIASIKLVL